MKIEGLIRQLLIFNMAVMFRRGIIIPTVWLSFSPPKQYTLHIERETATFLFGIFLSSVLTPFVKYAWT